MFSASKVQGMMGGCGWDGAYGHIKELGFPHSHIKGNSVLKACWANIPYVCWVHKTTHLMP